MFYVLSGNNRMRTLREASEKARQQYKRGATAQMARDGLDTAGLNIPIKAALWQPSSVDEAKKVADMANTDASGGTDMGTSGRAIMAARAIEQEGLIDEFKPDENGDVTAASNLPFMRALHARVGKIFQPDGETISEEEQVTR